MKVKKVCCVVFSIMAIFSRFQSSIPRLHWKSWRIEFLRKLVRVQKRWDGKGNILKVMVIFCQNVKWHSLSTVEISFINTWCRKYDSKQFRFSHSIQSNLAVFRIRAKVLRAPSKMYLFAKKIRINYVVVKANRKSEFCWIPWNWM